MRFPLKGKIVASYYNDENGCGLTAVTKATKYGTFHYTAMADIDDADVQNEWDGYKFCEHRCDSQALKERKHRLHERYLGAKRAYDVLNQKATWSEPQQIVLDQLWNQVCIARKDYLEAKSLYEEHVAYYPELCKKTIAERRKVRELEKARNSIDNEGQ